MKILWRKIGFWIRKIMGRSTARDRFLITFRKMIYLGEERDDLYRKYVLKREEFGKAREDCLRAGEEMRHGKI